MSDLTPRGILDAIHEGLEESALLVALGYEASQGRPGREFLNNALERRGYGRPIDEPKIDQLKAPGSYPDEWMLAIAEAITGRPNAPLREVISVLRKKTTNGAIVSQ